jgi:hypothetical protein
MICLRCGKYINGNSELEREIGLCQCKRLRDRPQDNHYDGRGTEDDYIAPGVRRRNVDRLNEDELSIVE